MTPFEAYKLYLAIKMHFTSPQYDFFKYHGKVNAKIQTFETRKDRFHFAKLARHKDPTGYLVAQFSSGNTTGWVGELFTEEAERTYTQYLARQQSVGYNFNVELERLSGDFLSHFKVRDGQHPQLLVLFKRGNVSIETMVILNNLLNFFPIWDRKINDTIIWPGIRDRCVKFSPFLQYDRAKTSKAIKEIINDLQRAD